MTNCMSITGRIVAMWHGPFRFSVVDPNDVIAFDNAAMTTDVNDLEMHAKEPRSRSPKIALSKVANV